MKRSYEMRETTADKRKMRSGITGRQTLVYYLLALICCLMLGCEQPGATPARPDETVPTQPDGTTPAQPDGTTAQPGAGVATASLKVSAGNLRPAFSPAITEYTVTVNHRVETITVTLAISGAARVSAPNGEAQPLVTGETVITLTVTMEDGTEKTYTVTVRRLSDTPIAIGTTAKLAKIGVDDEYPLAANYKLDADLTLTDWVPIGPDEDNAFTGSFDGGDHTITIQSIATSVFRDGTEDHPAGGYLGVFGYTRGSPGVKTIVQNMTVITALNHAVIKKGAYYVGSLVGYAGEYTALSGITVEGKLSFSNDYASELRMPVYVGGVAGALIASELRDSSNDADIYAFGKAYSGAYNYAGGLVGIFDRNAVIWGMNPKVVAGAPFAGSSIVDCHNTGDVSGETSGPATNVFVGGIAGGSCYGFKTYYSGRIEDCSSTGNISAGGGGYWSFAGGIAGTICGDGDGYDRLAGETNDSSVTGPTRIVRCYATGNVTTNGPSGSWPYVGGIVGYNYYGAVVAQCSFSGEVLSAGEGIYDYTGGIAGYNSQLGGHPSIIEDCWSKGTVSGRINAGGIVGQNQVFAITRRCYSIAALSVRAPNGAKGNTSQQGAGGIAGYNAGTVRDCVALNPSITSTGGFTRVYRVVGDALAGDLVNNAAFSNMIITITPTPGSPNPPEPGEDKKSGKNCVAKPPQPVFEEMGWNFVTVWKMEEEGYPIFLDKRCLDS
jgi:VCBS repeat-containing protein